MRFFTATLSAGCLLTLALITTPVFAQQYRPRTDVPTDRTADGQAGVDPVGRDWLDLDLFAESVHSPRAFAAGARPLDEPSRYDDEHMAASTKYPRQQQPTASPPFGEDWRAKCAQRCDERMMDVTGVGVETIATSQVEVHVTVEYRKMLVNATNQPLQVQPEDTVIASLISTVQQEVSRKAAAVVEYLQKDASIAQYITKLRTSGLTLEAQNEWVNNRMILNGYRASNSISFRVDIPMAGTVVDGIVERGVTRIDGINFVATPKELNAARHVAITSAVDDAINQALSALSGLGKAMAPLRKTDLHIVRLDVIGVTRPEADAAAPNTRTFSSGGSPRAEAMMAKSFEAGPTPIEGDEKSVTATVALKIRF